MSNAKTVRRMNPSFKTGLDPITGIRRVIEGGKKVTYLPLATFVGQIDLPTDPTLRKDCQVPNHDQDAANYVAYRFMVTDGYLLVNDFRSGDASSSALFSIKEKQIEQQNGRVDRFFYIRLDDCNEPATHKVTIVDGEAIEAAIAGKVEGQIFANLAVLKNRATGGIVVTPIA